MKETINKPIITLIIVLSGIFIINRSNQNKIDPGSTEIMSFEILGHIKYLASDNLRGRLPGTPGSKLAIDYIGKHRVLNQRVQKVISNLSHSSTMYRWVKEICYAFVIPENNIKCKKILFL